MVGNGGGSQSAPLACHESEDQEPRRWAVLCRRMRRPKLPPRSSGIVLVSLVLAPVNGVRQMGRRENMAFESGVHDLVIQAETLSTDLLRENNPLAAAAIREIREPRNHRSSVRRQKRSLCRLLRTDSNLQKHGHIGLITSNQGNLRHGQSSLKRVSKMTTSEGTGLFLKMHLPTSPA